jgi:hypothetical protein
LVAFSFEPQGQIFLSDVSAFNLSSLTVSCALIEPQEGFFELRNGDSVLTAFEFSTSGLLVTLDALESCGNHSLNESAIGLLAILAAAEWSVLPFDTQANPMDKATGRVIVLINFVFYETVFNCVH